MVCSAPDALSPDALSPGALSPDTLSTCALSPLLLVLMGLVKVCFIVKSYEECPISLIYFVRNTIMDIFPKKMHL